MSQHDSQAMKDRILGALCEAFDHQRRERLIAGALRVRFVVRPTSFLKAGQHVYARSVRGLVHENRPSGNAKRSGLLAETGPFVVQCECVIRRRRGAR